MADINFYVGMYDGLPVHLCNYLPIDVTYSACDIATKEEVKIMSDEKIDGFELNGNLYVSPKVYNALKNLKIKPQQ